MGGTPGYEWYHTPNYIYDALCTKGGQKGRIRDSGEDHYGFCGVCDKVGEVSRLGCLDAGEED